MCKVHCIRIALNQQDWKKSKETFIQRWISSKKNISSSSHTVYTAPTAEQSLFDIQQKITLTPRIDISHYAAYKPTHFSSFRSTTTRTNFTLRTNITLRKTSSFSHSRAPSPHTTITTHHHHRRLIYIWTLARGRRLRSSGNGALFIDQPSRRRKWKMYKIYNGMCTVPGCWYCARIWSQEWGFSSVFRGSLFRVLGKVWCPRWGFGSDCSMVLIFEVFFCCCGSGMKVVG